MTTLTNVIYLGLDATVASTDAANVVRGPKRIHQESQRSTSQLDVFGTGKVVWLQEENGNCGKLPAAASDGQ